MTATLPRILPSPDGKPLPPEGTATAFRAFTPELAAGRRAWTAAGAAFLAGLFDQLAPDRDTTQATGRDDPVRDALTCGGPLHHSTCLELGAGAGAGTGAGTGQFTRLLASVFPTVISLDLSEQMLRQAVGRSAARVRADAGALAVADASIPTVAAIDVLLFPTETARVQAPDDVLLWINQLAVETIRPVREEIERRIRGLLAELGIETA
ncbi:methyltransferase family protein [Streptomyces sp. CEV 2-1]|uniref:methyltransferase domain-containing protein n=1 Tax=Streptomyces sp. CEV 2-1 TaxID=2485153 RepID=UPI000FA42331|nr:methyltransferase domain-containing protein [Streptomyces sp. CEV 2-1]ROQ77093.1 methyltransferase family protein [Streptomyces sp. CEV 2-1]